MSDDLKGETRDIEEVNNEEVNTTASSGERENASSAKMFLYGFFLFIF